MNDGTDSGNQGPGSFSEAPLPLNDTDPDSVKLGPADWVDGEARV